MIWTWSLAGIFNTILAIFMNRHEDQKRLDQLAGLQYVWNITLKGIYFIIIYIFCFLLYNRLHIGQPVVFSLLTGHSTSFSATKSPKPQKPKEKQRRVWDMGGSSPTALDYSDPNSPDVPVEPARDVCINTIFVLLQSFSGVSWATDFVLLFCIVSEGAG